jgi:hypothetical protein
MWAFLKRTTFSHLVLKAAELKSGGFSSGSGAAGVSTPTYMTHPIATMRRIVHLRLHRLLKFLTNMPAMLVAKLRHDKGAWA